MAAKVMINADDFGFSHGANAAVAIARARGLLTSASLMVTGECAGEAVEIARGDPGLAVGLHLTLSDGRSALPAMTIPALVDEAGKFAASPVGAALRYYFGPEARRQLRLEIEAQFEAFVRTGLRLDHVNGHQHLHAHPVVAPIAVELAKRCGAAGFRVPCDPVWASLAADRSGLAAKLGVALGHGYMARGCSGLVREAGLTACEVTVGSMMSGEMSAEYVIEMLGRIDAKSVEVFVHPSNGDIEIPFGPNRGDLEAVIDPRLKRFLEEKGIELTTYSGLRKEVSACDMG